MYTLEVVFLKEINVSLCCFEVDQYILVLVSVLQGKSFRSHSQF